MEEKDYSRPPLHGENNADESSGTTPDLASYYATAAAAASSGHEFYPEENLSDDTEEASVENAPVSARTSDDEHTVPADEDTTPEVPEEAVASENETTSPSGDSDDEFDAPAVAKENASMENALDNASSEDVSPTDAPADGHDNPADEGNALTDNEDQDIPSSDISDDGSPHGPLDLLSEQGDDTSSEEQKDGDDTSASKEPVPPYEQVPAFAAFQAPEKKEESADDDEPEGAEDDVPMSIMGHLNELRRRLFRIVIIVILGFVAFYGVSEPLYAFLSAPLQACMPEGSKLIYTSPQGAFFTYMKVALVASLFGTSPFSFYQLWAFIAPGLYREERRAVLPLAFFSSIFFLAGAAFCFFLVFPIAFQFFMGFATDTIVPMISVEEYLSFALKLLLAFGIVFEMPLFAYFLSRFGILSPAFMRRSRRYAILVIFIVAAILTPPDVFSQCLMAIPMLVLYEVSIYVSAMAYKKKEDHAGQKDTEKEND